MMPTNLFLPEGIQRFNTDQLEVELNQVWQAVLARLLPLELLTGLAVELLEVDITDAGLEAISQQNRDIFVLRANQVGLALLYNRAYFQASIVFERLISNAQMYIQNSGNVRHLGALKANLGVAYILTGNYDAGVNLLLETATVDDVNTYQIPDPSQSYAITLLRDVLLNQVLDNIITICNQQFNIATGHPLTRENISTVANHLNPFGEVTLVSIIPLLQHSRWHQQVSTTFGRVRFMDGIRWLSALLESTVIRIGSNSLDQPTRNRFNANRITLWEAYSNLFRGQGWWAQAERFRQDNQGITDVNRNDTDADIIQKYQQLLGLPHTTRDEILTQGVLLTRLTRNFAAHYLEAPTTVINQVGQELIRYQLLTLLLIFDWAYQEGHFTQLSPPGIWR